MINICINRLVLILIIMVVIGKAENVSANNSCPSASGHGNLIIADKLRTFSFHARESKRGEVSGSFELKSRAVGARAHAEINCLRVEGNEAFMSGMLTQVDGIDDMLVGDAVWFHVVDNGEGRKATADQISLVLVEIEPIPEPIFCDTLPSEIPADVLESVNLQDILRGNIQVNP